MRKKCAIFLVLGILTSFHSSIWAQDNTEEGIGIQSKAESTKGAQVEASVIENQEVSEDQELTQLIKYVLTTSSDTVKYVGIIVAIILPFVLAGLGFQIFRSYQFEREIRGTRQLMLEEYQKVIAIRSQTEKLISQTKSEMQNLEQFVGQLATDFLNKKTEELAAEFKGRVEEGLLEIKKKDDEMTKSVELMKRLETLDLSLTPTVYHERGVIYLNQKNYFKAIENFNKTLEFEPKNINALIDRGRAHLGNEKFDEAVHDFTNVISTSY